MAYVGGKGKCPKEFIQILQNELDKNPSATYLEPFCGYLHVTKRLSFGPERKVIISDYKEDLIHLHAGIREGWEFRKFITLEDHIKARDRGPSFERGLIRFGASYCGGFFNGFMSYRFYITGGYVRNQCEEHFNHYELIKPVLKKCSIHRCSFADWKPKGCIIYCDPPYRGTTDYDTEFDYRQFDAVVSEWAKTNIVFISEYVQPDVSGIHEVFSFEKFCTIADTSNTDKRIEKLFKVGKLSSSSSLNTIPQFVPRRDPELHLEDPTPEKISEAVKDAIRKYFYHPKLSRKRIAEYEKRFGSFDPRKIHEEYMKKKGIHISHIEKPVNTFCSLRRMIKRSAVMFR